MRHLFDVTLDHEAPPEFMIEELEKLRRKNERRPGILLPLPQPLPEGPLSEGLRDETETREPEVPRSSVITFDL